VAGVNVLETVGPIPRAPLLVGNRQYVKTIVEAIEEAVRKSTHELPAGFAQDLGA